MRIQMRTPLGEFALKIPEKGEKGVKNGISETG